MLFDSLFSRSSEKTVAPLASHPAFPLILGSWFALLLGVGSLIVPEAVLEGVLHSSGLLSLLPIGAVPFSPAAQLAIALAGMAAGGAFGVCMARVFAIRLRGPQARKPMYRTMATRRLAKPKGPSRAAPGTHIAASDTPCAPVEPADQQRSVNMAEDHGPSHFWTGSTPHTAPPERAAAPLATSENPSAPEQAHSSASSLEDLSLEELINRFHGVLADLQPPLSPEEMAADPVAEDNAPAPYRPAQYAVQQAAPHVAPHRAQAKATNPLFLSVNDWAEPEPPIAEPATTETQPNTDQATPAAIPIAFPQRGTARSLSPLDTGTSGPAAARLAEAPVGEPLAGTAIPPLPRFRRIKSAAD